MSIHEDVLSSMFLLASSGVFNLAVDGWSNCGCGCLADFPGSKVGKINLFSSFFDYLLALIINRYPE
jgi:hypothetical protein